MNEKLKGRLLKLLALTKSANHHEAANARSRIEKLCKLHGVDIRDLESEDEEVFMYWFPYGSKYEKSVLFNTLWRVTNVAETWSNKSKPNKVGVKCTRSQAAEVELWWRVMRKAFLAEMNKTLEDLAHGFIIVNKLFGKDDEQAERGEPDWDKVARAERLAASIEPVQVLKLLEGE